MASRKAVNASPAVIFPTRSSTDTLSDFLLEILKSIPSVPRLRHTLHDRFQDVIGIDPLRFALEVENHAMSQRRQHDRANIGRSHFISSGKQRFNFATDDQSLRP